MVSEIYRLVMKLRSVVRGRFKIIIVFENEKQQYIFESTMKKEFTPVQLSYCYTDAILARFRVADCPIETRVGYE